MENSEFGGSNTIVICGLFMFDQPNVGKENIKWHSGRRKFEPRPGDRLS